MRPARGFLKGQHPQNASSAPLQEHASTEVERERERELFKSEESPTTLCASLPQILPAIVAYICIYVVDAKIKMRSLTVHLSVEWPTTDRR